MSKKKKAAAKAIKVFIFMSSGSMVVLTEDGRRINLMEVESVEEAKKIAQGESLSRSIFDKLGTTNFSTLWIDEPGDIGKNPEVIEACRLMEERQKYAQPEPNDNGEIVVHSKGMTFKIWMGAEFNAISVCDLKVDDFCIFYLEDIDQIDEGPMYKVVSAPINDGNDGDYIITLKKMDDIKQPINGSPAAEGKTDSKTAIIQVECERTPTEQVLFGMINDLETVEMEKASANARFNARIKEAKEALFNANHGKLYTDVFCNIVDDLETGVRTYLDQKTDKVVKTEGLPRQIALDLDKVMPKPEEAPTTEEPIDGAGEQPETETTETVPDDLPMDNDEEGQ